MSSSSSVYIGVGILILILVVAAVWYFSPPPLDDFTIEVGLVVAYGQTVPDSQKVVKRIKVSDLKSTLDSLHNTAVNPDPTLTASTEEVNINLFQYEIRHVTKKHKDYSIRFSVRNPNATGTRLLTIKYDTFKTISYSPDFIWEIQPNIVYKSE